MTRAANGHTYFFREPKALTAVCEEIVAPRARSGRSTTIWCIGCATGEEPYSLAIAARAHGGDRVQIVASDVNEAALEHAKRGRYLPRALRKIAPGDVDSWFRPDGEGGYTILPEIRDMVSFVAHDVCTAPIAPPAGSFFDILFCRNVFLYLDPLSIRRAIACLSSVMGEKSLLVLGATELLGERVLAALAPEHRLHSVWVRDVLCYRRGLGPSFSISIVT